MQVLTDPELDRRLQRDGFVTLQVFGSEQVARLRNEFGRLRGWDGTGFQSDLVVADPDYRRATSETIGAALDAAVVDLFQGHVPFLHNFLCKYPGGDSSLYLHRDWMYVDERRGARTYVAWVALEDITGHNGQLRVLRGSHRLDPSLRGTNLVAPWIRHEDEIEERLLAVPVKAGEVIIFDNALVHSSFPNHTEVPRVAAAVGLRPAAAPLVHFRSRDDGKAVRYDVDESFFLTATPQSLMAAPPDLPIMEELADDPLDFSAPELASLLDQGRQAKIDAAQRVIRHGSDRVKAGLSDLGERSAQLTSKITSRSTDPVEPRPPLLERLRSGYGTWSTRAAIAVLGLNEAVINRFGPDHPAVWDPDQFEWSRRVEAAWPNVKAEVEALLSGPTDIPHIEDVTGGIPQGNVGPWRTFVLMHQGKWIDFNCERCPRTTALVKGIPGLTVAGFSVLEPGAYITSHRGPNKGALRYQLGVIVPGKDGDCRIRVGDEMLHWREGEGVAFDFTFEHEAWNDTDEIRVLLMLEFLTPLPAYLAAPNWLAQHAMGMFPTTRDMKERLKLLEPTLTKAPAA